MSKGTLQFGYKTGWLAIASTDTPRVLEALRMSWVQRAHVGDALPDAMKGQIRAFVTPPIDGWTLCIGWPLLELAVGNASGDGLVFGDFIARLSAELDCEVQYFSSFRGTGSTSWGRAKQGKLLRAYHDHAEADEINIEIGERTAEERALGFFVRPRDVDPRADPDDEWVAGEEDVTALAARWSLDPLVERTIGQGWLGNFDRPFWKLW